MPKSLEDVASAPHVIPAKGGIPELRMAASLTLADIAEFRRKVRGERLKVLRESGLAVGDPLYQATLVTALSAPVSQVEIDGFFQEDAGHRYFLWLHLRRGGTKATLDEVLAWDIPSEVWVEVDSLMFKRVEEPVPPLASEGAK